MQNVTLKQLRALEAVARTGKVTAAAELLSVTPPAVTTQVKLIEEMAGLPLIERVGDRFLPTDAGQQVLAAGARIESALSECNDVLRAMKGLSGGKVSLAVVSTAKYFAPRALGAFGKEHPTIELRLTVSNRGELFTALRNDAVDIAVMGRPPEDIEVELWPIGDHPHIMIAPPDHPLAAKKNIEVADLAGETFLVRELGSGTRMLMERRLSEAGVTPKVEIEIGTNETIKQAVIAGLGISFLSAHTVSYEIADGRLVELDVVGMPEMRQWHVVKRADKRLLPAAEALRAFLVSEGERFLPERNAGR